MQTRECDILIVGAGPAGSSAARAAADHGLNVMVVDRCAVVGVPVQCAEYIPAQLVGVVNLGRAYIIQKIEGMHTFVNGCRTAETRSPGFVIQRDRFDQALAEAARASGVVYRLSTRALSMDGGAVVVKDNRGVIENIAARVIIGADGPRSRVGRWIDMKNHDLVPGAQVRVPLVNPAQHTQVHFVPEFFGGYGWLFPRGDMANVGVGCKRRFPEDKPIGSVLRRFLDALARDGWIRNQPTVYTAGWIPAHPMKHLVKDNIMLAGDAAGQTHPITGAGIAQAVMGGKMAGKWAARAVVENDLQLLNEYEAEWHGVFGRSQSLAARRRIELEQSWDRLEEVIDTCWVAFKEYYDAG